MLTIYWCFLCATYNDIMFIKTSLLKYVDVLLEIFQI